MRSFPSCWNKTLTKLGFRRAAVHRRATPLPHGRRTRIESLESRQMMAADYLVTTHLDVVNASDGVLSLREAITAAAGDGQNDTDVIEFSSAVIEKGRLTLGGSQLSVNTKVNIQGPGANQLAIDANQLSRVFEVSTGIEASISGLTITGGKTTTSSPNGNWGGGILSYGDLTLSRVAIVGNQTDYTSTHYINYGGGVTSLGGSFRLIDSTVDGNRARYGGGLAIDVGAGKVMEVTRSTVSNNTALNGAGSGFAGGLSVGGTATSTLTIANSTFSGNTSWHSGAIRTGSATTNLKIVNSTITDNHADVTAGVAGGIHNAYGSKITLHNSIIARNTAINYEYEDIWGSMSWNTTDPSSNNILGIQYSTHPLNSIQHSDLVHGQNGNQVGNQSTPINPLLGPLANNGGYTKTHMPLTGSPTINSGSNSKATAAGLTVDQRGWNRNVDLSGTASALVDIGAFELGLIVSTGVDAASDGNYAHGNLSLREALALAAIVPGKNEIEFDMSEVGPVIELAAGQLAITSAVDIKGPGLSALTIDANAQSRVFQVSTGIEATITGLTITGGKTTDNSPSGNRGGGIFSEGDLRLERVAIVGNETTYSSAGANNYGGGVANSNGSFRLIDSTVDDNRARYAGGLAVNVGAGKVMEIFGSTVSNNIGLNDGGNGSAGGLSVSGTATSTLTIANSTVSGNSSFHSGGIRTSSATTNLKIIGSTITDNHADVTAGVAGGVHNAYASTITIHNTIIARNTAINYQFEDIWGSMSGNSADPSSNNILGMQYSTHPLGSIQHSNLVNGVNGNQVGNQTTTVNPLLGSLADNGGFTKTHALLTGSPAIDKGKDVNAAAYNLVRDQRGFTRTTDIPGVTNGAGGASDIGAVEYGISALLDTNGKLTIDDTATNINQVVLAVGVVADQLVLTLNGKPTPYTVDQIEAIEVIGGGGNDVLDLSAINPYILWNLEAVTIDGGVGNDTITGTIAGDRIIGGDGANSLYGGLGDDAYVITDQWVSGPGRSYTIYDDGGVDALDFSGWTGATGVTVDLAKPANIAQLVDAGSHVSVTFAQFESMEMAIGSSKGDVIKGNSKDNVLIGGAGSDNLKDTVGNNIFDGGDGNDTLEGGSGDDDVRSGSGSDQIITSAGKDKYDADASDNAKPFIFNPGPLSVRRDQDLIVRIGASDADSVFGQWTYSFPSGRPAELADFDQKGLFIWQNNSGDPVGATRQVVVRVTDPDGDYAETTIIVDEYDYNDSAPDLKFYDGGKVLSHSKSGAVYDDVIERSIDDPSVSGGTHSRTITFNLGGVDTQTPSNNLTYRLLEGPGTLTGNIYTWNANHSDAGKTYRLLFEVEDTGSPDGGAPRKSQDYVLLDIEKRVSPPTVGYNAPMAVDFAFPLGQGSTLSATLGGIPSNGVYMPNYYSSTGKPATFSTVHAPTVGTLAWTNAANGSFTYTPPSTDFQGVVKFRYKLSAYVNDELNPQGHVPNYLDSNTAEVTINVGKEYITDIDGSIPDATEASVPMKLVWNRDDDNANGIEDYLEVTGGVANEDDLIELDLNNFLRGDVDPHDMYFFFQEESQHVRIWDSPNKGQEILPLSQMFLDDLPDKVWLEAVSGAGGAPQGWIVQAAGSPDSPLISGPTFGYVASDVVRVETRANLTAYRPIKEHAREIDLGPLTVPEQWEEDSDLGPGIRINTDFDAGEEGSPDYLEDGYVDNDLIKIDVHSAYFTQSLAFQTNHTGLRVWATPGKVGTPVLDYATGFQSAALTQTTYWVEYFDFAARNDIRLDIVDLNSLETEDTLLFHPFESIVIAFSGETGSGYETVLAALGVVGLGTVPAGKQTEFIAVARDLYDRGFDVHYFDVSDHDSDVSGNLANLLNDQTLHGPAFEVTDNAVNNRYAPYVGIFGWSHGGGATYKLAETIDNLNYGFNHPWSATVWATAYIDAVAYEPLKSGQMALANTEGANPVPEYRLPPSLSHANWYQTKTDEFNGTTGVPQGDIDENLTALLTDPTIPNHREILREIFDDQSNHKRTRLRDHFEDKMPSR